MVNEARSLIPTDLLSLLAHPGVGFENRAWPRERLGTNGQPALTVLRDQVLAFAKRRSAWVCVKGQRLQGLVGARRRGGDEAWEIDYLIDTTKEQSVTARMLEHAVSEAGKEGAHKLFLRVAMEAGLMRAAAAAGFVAYQEDVLYCRRGALDVPPLPLRPALPSDSYQVFRLYSRATPESTRRLEAATFAEWHAAQERKWVRGGVQLVLEQDGNVQAFVRAARMPQGLLVDLLLEPGMVTQAVALVSAASAATGAQRESAYVLVPRGDPSLAAQLEQAGFEQQQEYVSLVRRTARPLTLPKKSAVVAGNAVGV